MFLGLLQHRGAQHTLPHTAAPIKSPTFCLAASQDDNKHITWGGAASLILMRGKGKGNYFQVYLSQQNNRAEQSKEIRLFNEFYFNMVETKDFTLAALKKFQNISIKEEKLMNS